MVLVIKPRVSGHRVWRGARHLLRLRVALGLLAVLSLTTAGELGFVEPAGAQLIPVTIVSPVNGATVMGTTVQLKATAPGATGLNFDISLPFYAQEIPATLTSAGDWVATWNSTTVPNSTWLIGGQEPIGPVTIGAEALPGDYVDENAATVTVNNPTPTTAVLVPTNGTTVSGTDVALDASASPYPGVANVSFYLSSSPTFSHDTLIGSVAAPPNLGGWIASWNSTNFAPGTYYLESVASYPPVYGESGASGTSSPIMVTVTDAPVVTTQPTNLAGASGGRVTFSAAASGSPAPSVTWQYLALGATNWTTGISPTTTSTTGSTTTGTYTISDLNAYVSGTQLRALFTNTAGSAYTNPVTLSVTPPGIPKSPFQVPQITAQPQSQTVAPGDSVNFTAAASGVPTPTLIWQFSINQGSSWTTLTDATTTTLSATNVSRYVNGIEVEAVFTNPAGTTTTNPATLTVTPGA